MKLATLLSAAGILSLLAPLPALAQWKANVEQEVYVNSLNDCSTLAMNYPHYALTGAGVVNGTPTCFFFGTAEIEAIQATSQTKCKMMETDGVVLVAIKAVPGGRRVACLYTERIQ